MAVLTLIVDEEHIEEHQYRQALTIVDNYMLSKKKQIEKQQLAIAEAEQKFLAVNEESKQLQKLLNERTAELKSISIGQKTKEEIIKAKAKQINDYQISYDLNDIFSKQFINYLTVYFHQYKKRVINPSYVLKRHLSGINIYKFNRVTNFKTNHVISLVKFLNAQNIECSHRIDNDGKLIAKQFYDNKIIYS